MTKRKSITDVAQVQCVNANRHTERGMATLERSMQQGGWIGAVTVAADGETFDGSARVEKAATLFADAEPIVVETDGTRPVIVKRTDIATADDPRAVRLGLAANRVAQLNLDFDPEVLRQIADEGDIDLAGLFTEFELDDLAMPAELPTPGDGGDAFDATPEDGPTRAQFGDLWILRSSDGREHRLIVGDSTDAATVARLMDGERADMVWADPPYGQMFQSNHRTATPKFDYIAGDDKPLIEFMPTITDIPVWYICCRWDKASAFIQAIEAAKYTVVNWIVWHKSRGSMGDLEAAYRPTHETILYCSKERTLFVKTGRDDDTWDIDTDAPSSYEHPTQKPIALPQRAIENHCPVNGILYDPFFGSGPSLIAAHRTGRRCYGVEISCQYADVVLRRAESEGLTCELADRVSDS